MWNRPQECDSTSFANVWAGWMIRGLSNRTGGIIVTVQNRTAQDVMDHGDMPGLIAACVIFHPAGQWAGWLCLY